VRLFIIDDDDDDDDDDDVLNFVENMNNSSLQMKD
jgi:hypothetical protein